jgi:hypothetical protein
MKVKKYLSVFAVVCAGALTLAGCSDYDNGYNEAAIKFQEEFKNTFGDIDPEQDWNLAERATVTVNTQTTSNIKIYALRGSEYTLVGDYKGVNGTQMLGVDVIEGTRNLLVSDGRTAQKCIPGDVVVFNSMSTRTTHETTGGFIEVTKLSGPVDDLGDGKTYQKYRFSTEAEAKQAVDEKTGIVAQGKVNLHRVINNFSYVSNGPFIIYPYYWYTAAGNTVGIYYYDENDLDGNGNPKIKTVPVYTIKENNNGQDPELYYENIVNVDDREIWNEASANVYANVDNSWKDDDHKLWPDNWSVDNGVGKAKFHYNGWSNESGPVGNSTRTSYDGSGMTVPFTEYWVGSGTLTPGTLWREITGLTPGAEYRVEVQTRLWKENGGSSYPSGVYFFVERDGNKVAINQDKDEDGVPCYKTKTSYTYDGKTHAIVYGKSSLKGKADDNGKLKIGFIVNDGTDATWLAFKDLKVFSRKPQTEWESTNGKESFGTITRGQGIKVDIPVGTKFGMYLYSEYNNGNHTYYSEAELNTADKTNGLPENATYGYGKKYVGSGDITDKNNWVSDSQLYPCYASTFTVEGQMFFGFEDWAYPEGSDMDLNDVVLAVSGLTPTVINEDPTTSTWLLACEDLGGTFDRDYNDLVFKVDYISGQTTAKVTPLAAGGTLASYIFHVPERGSEQCLGEIHQLFGFEPAVSGEYEAHNVTGTSRGTEGQTVTIEVPSDWSMAYYSTNTYGLPQKGETGDEVDAGYQNMGGFEIRTLRKGTEAIANASANWSNITALSSGASRIPAPNRGEAPYIICLPYSYIEANTPVGYDTETFWAWPREFMNIDGCYLDFPKWVSKHNTYGTWYENKKDGAPTVDDLKIQRPRASALLPSQLGHNQETIYVVKNSSGYYDVNSYEDLRANLTGVTSGTLSYFYIDTDGNERPLAADAHLYNGGPRTIIVKQAEDGTYAAGETRFTLNISEAVAKTDPTFYTATMINWNYWTVTSGNRTIDLTAGEQLYVGCRLTENEVYNGSGTFSVKSFSDGGTGSSYQVHDNDTRQYLVTTGSTAGGTITMVLHFSGDDQYNAKDITITINTTKTVKFIHNNLALSYVNGSLQMKTVTDDAAWTNFQKWRLISANKGDGFYFLYNVGANKYLRIGETKNDAGKVSGYFVEWVDSPNKDAQQERFLLTSEGYLGSARRSQYGRYLGSTQSWEDGAVINSPDAQGNAIINWTIQNTASAKKRM